MATFGTKVKELRVARHLKQEEFGPFGVTQSQLSLIETGQLEPSVDKIDNIAKVLQVSPIDLVSGTEAQAKYFGERLTSEDIANQSRNVKLTRSARIIAVEEAYKRIQLFHDLLYGASTWYTASVDNDAHYQHAARILRRTIEAAKEYDSDLAGRLEIPGSLLDQDPLCRGDIHDIRFAIKKSMAYARSLILEYPEANNSEQRSSIVREIGLEPIDAHLNRYNIVDSVDEKPVSVDEKSAWEDSLDEEEIPF
jgi:transcriptional regulator with XRE-family HTH domain